jgi:hypothetical protein
LGRAERQRKRTCVIGAVAYLATVLNHFKRHRTSIVHLHKQTRSPQMAAAVHTTTLCEFIGHLHRTRSLAGPGSFSGSCV